MLLSSLSVNADNNALHHFVWFAHLWGKVWWYLVHWYWEVDLFWGWRNSLSEPDPEITWNAPTKADLKCMLPVNKMLSVLQAGHFSNHPSVKRSVMHLGLKLSARHQANRVSTEFHQTSGQQSFNRVSSDIRPTEHWFIPFLRVEIQNKLRTTVQSRSPAPAVKWLSAFWPHQL